MSTGIQTRNIDIDIVIDIVNWNPQLQITSTVLGRRVSSDSLASSRFSEASNCSKLVKDHQKRNFFQVLASREFQILSRRSKYVLTKDKEEGMEDKLVFVEEGDGRKIFGLDWI